MMMSKVSPPTVIYVAGSGHSGSTLLNLLLGIDEDVDALGEMKRLKMHLERENAPSSVKDLKCDCGETIKECPYWKDVVDKLPTEELYPSTISWTQRISSLLAAFASKSEGHAYNENAFRHLEEQTGKKIFVDSSKDFRRLVSLYHSPVNLKIIHLVRDGRGVANSYKKIGDSAYTAAFDWMVVNTMIRTFLRLRMDDEDYLTVSYDCFAQNPKASIQKINEKFNLSVDEDKYLEEVNETTYHNFSGNAIRWQEIEEIKHDTSWKENLSTLETFFLNILCYIPNHNWVFKQ